MTFYGQKATVIAGGRRGLKETLIPTPGGLKQGRRPDILVRLDDGLNVGVNVGYLDSSGVPVLRELQAMEDLVNFANLPMFFVGYHRRR